MPLSTHIFNSAEAFLSRAQGFLERHESLNNLILGITMRLREQPDWYTGDNFMATVETAGGQIVMAAMMTPPHEVVLAGGKDVDQEMVDAFTSALMERGTLPPGVNGPALLSEQFAIDWAEANGLSYRVGMRERVYELRQVSAIPLSPGKLRAATITDLDQAIEWRQAFIAESLPDSPTDDPREASTRLLANGDIYFWDDPMPVAMCVKTRPTVHGTTVTGVYTPPEFRRRGYASSVVAAVSQLILDQGKQFCTLFTDLANPTSNRIYQKIGYFPVGDFTVYRFEDRDSHSDL